MKIFSKFYLIIIFHNIFIIDKLCSVSIKNNKPLLLILLYDGFRNDYLERGITPILNNFRYNGVYSDYLKTVYPPLAYPAAYSIVTGLYPESHGVTGRTYIGPQTGQKLEISSSSMFTQNESKPIWVLNKENGGKSACMMWPGQDVKSKTGLGCDLIQKYDKTLTLRKRADKMLDWIEDDADINLILFYVEELDRITHYFGPLSRNSTFMIKRLDLLTKYIISKLIELKVYHKANIFILSDHGMLPVLDTNEVQGDERQYKFPATEDLDDVNARYHYSYDDSKKEAFIQATNDFIVLIEAKRNVKLVRITPSVNVSGGLVEFAAAPNFALKLEKLKSGFSKYTGIYKNLKPPGSQQGPYGAHGYLRQNDAVFMAKGPMLAMFRKVEPFEMVDLYSAFTKILKITGDFELDGNFSRVLPIFIEQNPIQWPLVLMWIIVLSLIFTTCFFFIIKYLLLPDLKDRSISRTYSYSKKERKSNVRSSEHHKQKRPNPNRRH